ncbi:MAG: DUF1501 domain-containing protein [Acidimicrobiia bacterium]|nr:DUF1501 domain-containing protein [Acidimicrobiia bacterium]
MTGRQPSEGEGQSSSGEFRYGRELADVDGKDEIGYDGGAEYGHDEHGYDSGLVTRRRFLAGLAVSGAVGYGAFWALGRPEELATIDPTTTSRPPRTTGAAVTFPPSTTTTEAADELASNLLAPAPVDQRVLVLIELEGGNDGPSTVVPYGSGTYHDLRPTLAIPADQVLELDDEIGLNPNLGRLYNRQMAVVEGVGPVDGSMSHFEMVARWEQGDLSGTSGLRTGFLARLADALDDGSPTIGLSVDGFTPRFNNVTASTLSLNHLNSLRVLTKDEWIFPAYREAVTSFSGGPMTTTLVESWRHLVEIGNALPNEMTDIDEESAMVQEGGHLGRQLAIAAEIIRADIGVRVVHARLSGFDTHKGHQYKQESLLQRVDMAVDGFLQQLTDSGMAERVLVATSSEFGRRAEENATGLDHGAASTMLLFGPVRPGRYGAPSSFDDLDDRGNLKTMVPFDSYLGTLAEDWLGVEAATVLPTTPELLDIV